MRPSRERKKIGTALTLAELLVVIGIITLLIAVLLPALGRVREQANRVKCAANLRSIGHAMTLYTQQYGYYPCAIVNGSRGDFALWPPRLRVFLNGDRGVFRCPSQDDRCEWTRNSPPATLFAAAEEEAFGYERGESVLLVNGSFFSYGYNVVGAPPAGPSALYYGLGAKIKVLSRPDDDPYAGEVRASRVKLPSEMVAVTDSTADGNWDCVVGPVPNHPMSPGAVHSRGTNVLFCDGHVAWYLQRDIVVTAKSTESIGIWRMWNRDHEPHW